MRNLLLPLLLLAAVALGGCETRETLVGQWQGPWDKADFITQGMWQQLEKPLFQVEFFEDGTFVLSAAQPFGAKRLLEGRYQLHDNQAVEFWVTARVEDGTRYGVDESADGKTIKGELQKRKLSLTDEFGFIVVLEKAK